MRTVVVLVELGSQSNTGISDHSAMQWSRNLKRGLVGPIQFWDALIYPLKEVLMKVG